MNEFEKRLCDVLDQFNATFALNVSMSGDAEAQVDDQTTKKGKKKAKAAEVEAKQSVTTDEEQMVTKVTITGVRDGIDGAAFVESFCSLFGPLVEQMSNGTKAMVYEEGRGLAIRRVDED